jgi:23S rRNA (cytosine1962-C5)-methyltransferase
MPKDPTPADRVARLTKPLGRVIAAGHPWVYRDALSRFEASPGDIVTVREREGRFVGRGVAEAGPIAVRLWTTRDEPIDEAFVRRRVESALALRRRVQPPDTDAIRLLHGEGDRLGGAVCDRYGRYGVLALDGEATASWRDTILRALVEAAELEGLVVRTGRRGAKKIELAHGSVPEEVIVHEHGMRMPVDLWRGQKTGLFLDHRESRRIVRTLASGLSVLNLYGYTGGFSIAAGLGGARSVETVDVSQGALALADAGWRANGLPDGAHRSHAADVPEFLEKARASREARWDLIVSDPPSFAPSHDTRAAALKSYRALHRSCLKLLADGGLYLAASCSSHVDRDAFEQTLYDGAEKAGTVLQIVGRWGAAPDHPRLLAFPEGDYLKVVLCRVLR